MKIKINKICKFVSREYMKEKSVRKPKDKRELSMAWHTSLAACGEP